MVETAEAAGDLEATTGGTLSDSVVGAGGEVKRQTEKVRRQSKGAPGEVRRKLEGISAQARRKVKPQQATAQTQLPKV